MKKVTNWETAEFIKHDAYVTPQFKEIDKEENWDYVINVDKIFPISREIIFQNMYVVTLF